MQLEITAKRFDISVDIGSYSRSETRLTIEGVDESEVLQQMDAKQIVTYADVDELLDAIGADKAKEYFGLTEVE